ncbi:PREDICTED: RNA polymerase II subunit A C-terminal domain phosphatase [Dufourea novaeangliae]|uniref:RNA polymerase II subunit A C-terminal domain phosphatase n=1 Tax=Dufourea novaeangliae TaxID=178035 RepID=A0A154PG83_DUFNO|nr:PREDICTED: RNA polymerase II subunit A C-terminal domain phosphatase [Dufourea novaeangliae]KZC10842.1 RNA polymerase II subunit A C-terminal domain phosphatase [Dufourea novaeangliae]
MGSITVTFPLGGQPGKIIKWRVRMDTMVSAGRVLFLYQNIAPGTEDIKGPEKKYRATRFGRVTELLAKEGDIVQPGQVIMILEGCRHPTVMKDLCAECGVDLRVEGVGKQSKNVEISQASVPMVHSVPELKVCPELAEKIGKEDEQRLLNDRKLALLVDLDQTIVHTTNDNVPPNMKDVYHYQLYGPSSPWYHTRLRPHTRHFLSEMSRLYELHICTFGARNYAHTVAGLLDNDGTLFSHRILSRDECFDPASKTANLKALFPCGDDLVCIIDDREDVWQGCGNLVQVKPYHFFRHTGDIHAPPGLEKNDVPTLPELQNTNDLCMEGNQNETDKNGALELQKERITVDNSSEKETQETIEDKENICESKEKNNENTKDDTKDNIDQNPNSTNENKDIKVSEEKDENKDNETVENKNESNKTSEENDENEDKQKEEKECIAALTEATQDIKKDDIKYTENNVVDEDDDDYLLYLEDILRRIHAEFYTNFDIENGRKSLRDIIPRVRAQVLKGVHLTFSGLIPTNQKLHQSRAYKVARAFGAEVAQDLSDKTTHLVAIRPGTAKVNAAKKNGTIKIVNPDWLWTCAERWEHVDERLFPLTIKARASRIPPPHCSSPERIEEDEQRIENSFADSINPLMSFTPEEIEIMDKEVEEDMDDQEMEPPVFDVEYAYDEGCDKEAEQGGSDSEDSMHNERVINEPLKKKKKISHDSTEDDDSSSGKEDTQDDDDDDDDPVTRFRRGENLPDDLDLGDNSQDSVEDLEIMDNEDDREWNAMGAALEREFLSE